MTDVLTAVGRGFARSGWKSIVSATLAWVCLAAPTHAQLPRPEHPRPDKLRQAWHNLNGPWQFEIDRTEAADRRQPAFGRDLAGTITVPFCPESKLSGIGDVELMKNVWYRRTFDVPANLAGKRVRLHFGAVDYRAQAWLNGQPLGTHVGGNVGFDFEATPFLRPTDNELIVHAYDDTAGGDQPTGKQTHTVPHGGDYTRTTGIWQTVWLEAVGDTYVSTFCVVPDADNGRVIINASIDGPGTGLSLTAEATIDGKSVGRETVAASGRGNAIVLNLSDKRLWEPGKPFLYDLTFTLSKDGRPVDRVASYFGLRKVSIEGRSVLINGKRVFQRLVLDQGFYSDGVWTAPSDEALKGDIEKTLAAGFNGSRFHQKVFEPRYLYWADKLGLLVYGEYTNSGFRWRPQAYGDYLNEWTEVLERDRNHPCIIGWCPMNETPPAAVELQKIVWKQTRLLDPTRLVLETSGWTHGLDEAEVRDTHDYTAEGDRLARRWQRFFKDPPPPDLPARYGDGVHPRRGGRDPGVPFMISEFGGTGYDLTHPKPVSYGITPKTPEAFYDRYGALTAALLDNPDLFGFCWTQLTDIEQEQNGIYYYDRRPKFDTARIRALNTREAAYEKTGPVTPKPPSARETDYRVLVGAAADGDKAKPYRYTLARPAGDWVAPSFDDGRWKPAPAPFGTEAVAKTRWTTPDIWLRQTFTYDGRPIDSAAIVAWYDEDTEVYVNGKPVWAKTGDINRYEIFDVTAALKAALVKGDNTLAVHTRQSVGGQMIDVALLAAP